MDLDFVEEVDLLIDVVFERAFEELDVEVRFDVFVDLVDLVP